MVIDPVSATGVVIAALALAHQVLKSPKVTEADKKKIVEEASRLVEIAQMSDIDKATHKRQDKVLGKKYAGKEVAKKPQKKAPKKKRSVATQRGRLK